MVSFIKSPANSILTLDDSTKLNGSGNVELNALSENYITSVNGGITMGNGNGKSFGAAINILNNDGTTAVLVADNGVNSKIKDTIENLQKEIETEAEKDSPDQNIIIDKKSELKALKIAKAAQDILGEGYTKELGTSSADTGEITADTFTTKSENTGTINAIAIEGTENSESHGFAEQFNDKVYKGEVQMGYAENAFKWPATKLSKTLGNAINDKFKSGQKDANGAATQAAKNTNVAIGGAVAYSDASKNVDAIIKNSNINATSIKNTATRDDSDVSAGMGLAVSTNSGNQGTNVDVAISASINFIEGDTHALLLNNNVNGVTIKDNKGKIIKNPSLENKAAIDSLQVAGGLDIAGSSSGGKGFNLGGATAASKITNDLQSGIKGGSYDNLGNVDITADKKSNQIDVAVAGGITTGSGAKGFSFGGGVAVSDINNNSRAFLNNTTKFNSTGVVNVDALDSKNESSRNEYLSSRSINTDPTSYLNSDDKGKINGTNGGGNIVNVALGGGASTSDAAAGGLGISYAGISNLMNVDIFNNENITAQKLAANSTNKSNIVNVTVGLAGSNKSFSAAGAFGVSDVVNDGTINITKSNATADSFLSSAQSNAHIVNVAGQAALSKEFSVGLTFAYNAMNNTTGINVNGGTWNVKDFGAASTNNNYALAIGAGVAFSKDSAVLNGAIGLNLGSNSTKSIIDGATIKDLENLKVTATDKTSKTTIAGDINITKGGKVAAGGAVAYADIGTSDNKEVINAKVTNATITTKNNSTIDVEALDNATMNTVAVGVGGSVVDWTFITFQGAAAVSELNKENVAQISNSNITGDAANIIIKATSGGNSSDGLKIGDEKINVNNKVNTAAAVLDANLGSESLFDGALAISVNNLNQSTQANFINTSQPKTVSNAGNVNMFSNSEADILGVALGGAGGKSKVSAAGSVSYNYINNSAKTLAENLNVKADKNFGVVAQSDDKLANYAGAVDVNAKNTSEVKADGGVAALSVNVSETFFLSMGAAVAITNATFDNKVTADVDSSTITAAGDVNIQARDDHKSNETVVSAAASTGLAVSVNRMSTSINSGLSDLKSDQLGKTLSANDLTMNSDNASKDNADSDAGKLNGEFGKEERFLNSSAINKLLGGVHYNSKDAKNNIESTLTKRYAATVNYNNSLKNGVFANVQNGSTINATNNISINSTENNDLSITSGSGTGGIIGVGVGSTSIKVNRANTSNVIGSTLTAKNIELTTTNGQTGSDGILSKMYNATVASYGVSVGYNNVETNGTGEISIAGSKLTSNDNINVKATDNSKSKSYILDAGLKMYGYTGVFAYNTNTSQTGIEVSNKSALNAPNINLDTQNHTHRATDTLAISVGVLNIQTSTSEAKDTSTNFINVKGAGNSFTDDNLTFNATNAAQTYAHNNGQGYSELNAIIANGLSNSQTTSNISINDANTLNADTINITAQIGKDNEYTAQTDGFGISVSGIGVTFDKMTAKTKSTANIEIGNEYFGDNSTLNISALNKASRDAYMRNNSYSVVANSSNIWSYTFAEDKASITVGNNSTLKNANKLVALNITSDTQNNSNAAAKGTGGAIGADVGAGANAENSVNNTSSATLNGNWDITNDLTLTATQHDNAYISAYSARGAIITGGSSSLDNQIKGLSTAKISDGSTINAKTINVNAKNYIKTDKYSSDFDHTLYGLMIGALDDIDSQTSKATANKSANINIGNNATITTSGKQIYDAASDYNLKNDVYAEGGSALASLRWVKSHNYITADEKISVGTGAQLKNEGGSYSDGGITFAAHDNLELNLGSTGHADGGAGGYVRAETLTDLTRNQNIELNGTVKSAKDLNFYAGANANGERSRVHSFAQAISQVKTLISDGSADVIRAGKTNSNVNINSGASGETMHDVNIISNAGFEVYEERPFYGSMYSSEGEYKVVTSDQGSVTSGDYKHNNNVKVDGELKAANTPNATITISGTAIPDNFIFVDTNLKNLSYNVKSGNATVTSKNTNLSGMTSEKAFAQQIYNGITTSTVNPEDSLIPRYKEVCDSIKNYHVVGKEDIVVYSGFLQEKKSLEEEMANLGMGHYNDDGEFLLASTSKSIGIKTLVLPDVEVSGGSINVSTDNFSGSGKLNASGVPQIDVENNSSVYLVTNKLTIADKGGNINFNGVNVKSNADIGSGANFAELKIADATKVPTITVSNNYAGSGSASIKADPNAKGYDELSDAEKKEIIAYTPLNYIQVSGNVDNPVGKSHINNTHGSIRINKGVTVNALDIEMTAKDSISQGYTKGIVNIAYTPQEAYAGEAAKLREKVGWDKNMPTSDQELTETSDKIYEGGTGRIAGDAIYLAARDININGLIQSGYNGFKANITQRDVDNATETTFFNGTTMYKVNDGGHKFNKDTGYYTLEPQVYYDKTNNKLYVEDINSTGGKVYLAGRISSTGNGKIVVSDGASNINITNDSSADMTLGKVTSSTGGGFIQIVDGEQDKLTEYSSGKTRTIENYSAWLATDKKQGKLTESAGLTIGQFVNYNPQAGLTYNWAEGTQQGIITRYHYKEEKTAWGYIRDPDFTFDLDELTETTEDFISKGYSSKVSKSDEKNSKPDAIGIGVYISNKTAMSDNLKLFAQSVITGNNYGGYRREGPNEHGPLMAYVDYDHYWTKTTDTKQIYKYSLKADYPISVGIIGEAGIFNAASSGENVIGKDLVLVGGNGAIGTQEKPFTVRLTGDLFDARANDEINLKKVGAGNFRIGAMYSPKAIRITNDEHGIIEHSAHSDEIAEAYINAYGELTFNGSAGMSSTPIVIRPHDSTILNLNGDEFYIKGVEGGALNLNNISGKVDINTAGSIKQTATGTNNLTSINVAANGDVILDGKNKLTAINISAIGGDFELKNDSDKLTANFGEELTGKVTITQRGDIDLAGAVSGNVLSLTSATGNIISTGGLQAAKEINLSVGTFTHEGEIYTDKLTIATDNGVTINNTENIFNSLEIASRDGKAINGSVDVTIKSDKFAPTIKNNVTGDVTLTNTKSGGLLSLGDGETINIGGTFTANAQGDFDYGATILAGKDISIRAQNIYRREGTTGYFSSPGKMLFDALQIGTAENPIFIANSKNKTSGLNIYKESYIRGVHDGILTLGNVMTDKNVSISSEGSIAQADDQSKIIDVDKLTVEAAKDITLDNAKNNIGTLVLNGGENIKVYSDPRKVLTVEGNLQATGDVDITSNKSLNVTGDVTITNRQRAT